jgi:predicted N-formylglutamate amidohydrolase
VGPFLNLGSLWHVGVLYNRDTRFAHLLMALLKRKEGLVVGDNEPYSVTDALDYTIPVIAEDEGQRAWGPLLARLLPQSYQKLVAADAVRPA